MEIRIITKENLEPDFSPLSLPVWIWLISWSIVLLVLWNPVSAPSGTIAASKLEAFCGKSTSPLLSIPVIYPGVFTDWASLLSVLYAVPIGSLLPITWDGIVFVFCLFDWIDWLELRLIFCEPCELTLLLRLLL